MNKDNFSLSNYSFVCRKISYLSNQELKKYIIFIEYKEDDGMVLFLATPVTVSHTSNLFIPCDQHKIPK